MPGKDIDIHKLYIIFMQGSMACVWLNMEKKLCAGKTEFQVKAKFLSLVLFENNSLV